MPQKYFRCRSEDHLIVRCLNLPKDIDKWKKQVRFSEKGNRAFQKECDYRKK